MKTFVHTIKKTTLLITSLVVCSQLAFAAPAKKSSKKNKSQPFSLSSKKLATPEPKITLQNVFQAAVSVAQDSSVKAKVLAEKTHKKLDQGGLQNEEVARLLVTLAGLTIKHPQLRYSAISYLEDASNLTPQWKDVAFQSSVWRAMSPRFNAEENIDEVALLRLSRLFDVAATSDKAPSGLVFYNGLTKFYENQPKVAIDRLARVPYDSFYYRRAKYIEGVMWTQLERLEDAKNAFQIVTSMEVSSEEKRMASDTIHVLRENAVLALARLHYEKREFLNSLAYYRSITNESDFFYNTLHEQGWAFFLAGYPNRALGAGYAVMTPFFAKQFNPDAYFLHSVVYYWLCDFDKSHEALKMFAEHVKGEGEPLQQIFASARLLPSRAVNDRFATLYDDAKRGVSPRNLGVGEKVYTSLLADKSLLRYYDGLQKFVSLRVSTSKSIRQNVGSERMQQSLLQFEAALRSMLGARVKDFLANLETEYTESVTQAKFLYLEILTAQKDALMGKRSVSGGEFVGQEKSFLDDLKTDTQKWTQNKKEFWYDELGHYVFQVQSKCKVQEDKFAKKR